MIRIKLFIAVAAIMVLYACNSNIKDKKAYTMPGFDSLASTPPMGWNSWDCLGMDVKEEQIKTVADYMAANLKQYGWEYVVIDAGWYHPVDFITAESYSLNPPQSIDGYGRLIPDTLKYPTARGGAGFKPLADYIHGKGLKFGIHVMRGIPWNAVAKNTPIKGTGYNACDIADLDDTCAWSRIMKGINMEKPGAREYYNSVFELYAEWGVDFVKVDDISMPYHASEIEGVHDAIINSEAPIVLSLSPGPAPVNQLGHLTENAHMWRISGDFWDDWKWLKRQFGLVNQWDSIHTPGHWPDADMLPIGKLRKTGGDAWIAEQLGSAIEEVTDEYSRFTDTEKYTLFTLYAIFRSPLILGGYLPENDSVTFKIITNEEVIAVNQKSENNHEILNKEGIIIWSADVNGSASKYIAIFNINDEDPLEVTIDWNKIGIHGEQMVRDLWARADLGKFNQEIAVNIDAHGCQLLKVGE
jgi:alpha-galactosidase